MIAPKPASIVENEILIIVCVLVGMNHDIWE